MGGNQRPSQPSQQKAGKEMELYQQQHCQLGLKETEKTGQNEGRLSNMCYCSRKGKNDVGGSEILRATTPTTGPEGRDSSSWVSKNRATSSVHGAGCLYPVVPQEQVHWRESRGQGCCRRPHGWCPVEMKRWGPLVQLWR